MVNVPEYKWLDLTMLKVVDDWDCPIGWIKGVSEEPPKIVVKGLKLFWSWTNKGVLYSNIRIDNDEERFFHTLQSTLKEISDDKENLRVKTLKKSQTNVLSELDKDGNGEVDVIEGNDFNFIT